MRAFAGLTCNGTDAISCLLFAPGIGEITGPRAWEEEEFCFDVEKRVLQVHSHGPGSYTYFSYDAGRSLGGRPEPDAMQLYEGGTLVVESRIDLRDLRGVDAASIAPPADTRSPGIRFSRPVRMPVMVGGQAEGRAMVHASLDMQGAVLEADLSSATSDDAGRAALELVLRGRFQPVRNVEQTNAYIDVRFVKQ